MSFPRSLTIRGRVHQGARGCPVHGMAANQGQGRPRSRFYQTAHRISDRFSPDVEDGFMRAMDRLQRQIDLAELRLQVTGGNLSQIESASGIGRLESILLGEDAIRDTLEQTATVTGAAGTDVLEDLFGLDAQFNRRHPNVVLFAREQAADLVVSIAADQREAIRIVLAAGADFGLTVDEQARMIREVVGLQPRHVQAPLNLAQELRDGQEAAATSRRLSAVDKQRIRSAIRRGEVTEEFVEEMVGRYTHSLRNYRAKSIARTETLRAAHHGQREAWNQGVEQGALPSNVRRIAVVTPDDRLRATHARIPGMNPDGVALDEKFKTPFGEKVGPPWEPNCRCGEGLIFPDEEQVATTEPTPDPEPTEPTPEMEQVDAPGTVEWAEENLANEVDFDLPRSAMAEINSGVATVFQWGGAEKIARFGWQTKRQRSLGRYQFSRKRGAHWDGDQLMIQKTFARNVDKKVGEYRATTQASVAKRIERRQRILDRPGRPEQVKEMAREKIEELQAITRWGVSDDSARPLFSVAAHEAGHGVYFNNDLREAWEAALTHNGVTRIDRLRVSEYAASDPDELFAEVVALIADGRVDEVPGPILTAWRQTTEDL